MTIGYRAWKVNGAGEADATLSLGSLIQGYTWEVGLNEARCLKPYRPAGMADPAHQAHVAPAPGCECGFWLLDTVQQALDKARSQIPVSPMGMMPVAGPARALVIGAVRAWGTVIEHEKGSRAGKAQVLGLLRPALRGHPMLRQVDDRELSALVERLGLLYDVPVYGDPEALATVSW